MNSMTAIALSAASLACAMAVWALVLLELGKRWISDHSSSALRKRQVEFEENLDRRLMATDARVEVGRRAIENLAKEVDENISTLRAQQAGVLAGQGQPRRSQFSR